MRVKCQFGVRYIFYSFLSVLFIYVFWQKWTLRLQFNRGREITPKKISKSSSVSTFLRLQIKESFCMADSVESKIIGKSSDIHF